MIVIIQAKQDYGTDLGMGNEVGEKCFDSGYILKTEPTVPVDEHNVGS